MLKGRNVEVRNGMINGCRNGFVVTVMEHMLKHLPVINNGGDGIIVEESNGNRVEGVHAYFNSRTGINIVNDRGKYSSQLCV